MKRTALLYFILVFLGFFLGCGRNDLRVTLNGDQEDVSVTKMTVYHNNRIFDSYTGIRSRLYSDIDRGDYYAKAECKGYKWSSPTLTVGGRSVFGVREYRIEIYVYVPGKKK